MKWTRDEYLDYMLGPETGRCMFTELFGLLIGLDEEWREQGATPEEIDLSAFEWDYVLRCECGGHCGPVIDRPKQVVKETEHELIERDGFGRLLKLDKRTATIPLPIEFPVKTFDDWLKFKPMFAYAPTRIDAAQLEQAKRARAEGQTIVAHIPGGFDTARNLMGEEVACMAYYDQPELMQDLLATLRDTALRVLDEISKHITVDILSVHEDFAGRSGPLVGPAQIREFLQPYYGDVAALLFDRGTSVFRIDSDGNVNAVVQALRACGINELFPMEPAAGMDIVKTRAAHGPALMLRGGIDKFVVRNGTKADIRRELEYKMQPKMRSGGVVFALDHRIPDGTPLENYRYYVDTGREILGLPPRGAAQSDRVFVRSA